MKIAFIDNTCNHGYTVMRYLNDRGHDTDLLLLSPGKGHNDPYADMILPKYTDKIQQLHWDKGFWKVPIAEIRRVRRTYGFILAADWVPGHFFRAGEKLDVFVPHGTDLFEYPFIPKPGLRNLSKITVGNWVASTLQRKGISKSCRFLIFDETNEENEKYLQAIRFPQGNRYNEGIPLIYYPQYSGGEFTAFCAANHYYQQLLGLKKEGCFLIFHHCQQIWRHAPHSLFNKRNDLLIKGFARFLETHTGVKVRLVMIEVGIDVPQSKELIRELGIAHLVLWLPPMRRSDIMACLSLADLGAGEFGHSWFSYNVIFEFLCMGVPALHNRDDAYFTERNKNLYPVFSATNENGIEQVLHQAIQDGAHFRERGAAGKEWYVAHTDLQISIIEKLLLPGRHT